jgi:magnesium transporter
LVYQEQSMQVAKIRLPWLLVNLIGLVLAGMLIKSFEVTLQEALFLIFFLPVVMGMGGNMGSQSATIAVRGLATGRISSSRGRIRHFLWQQVKVGAILAAACSLLTVLLTFLFQGSSLGYAVVIGVSLFLTITLASLNGSLIPVLFERWNIDPAVAAGPLVTTSNDITGILIYFGLASLLIDLLM